MKKITYFFLTSLAFPALLMSCKKETKAIGGSTVFGEQAVKENVSTGSWKFQHETIVYSPNDVDHGGGDACKEDDAYVFRLSGEALINWGAVDCDPYPIPSGSFANWQLLNDGSILKLSYIRDMPGGFTSGTDIYWTIELMTENKMVLKRQVQEYRKSYTVYDTYIK